MDRLLQQLAKAKRRADGGLVGSVVPAGLVFDDDRPSGFLFPERRRPAAPADVLQAAASGVRPHGEMALALGAVLGARPELLEDLQEALTAEVVAEVLKSSWAESFEKLPARSLFALGVWRGFFAAGRFPGRRSSVWSQLTALLRDETRWGSGDLDRGEVYDPIYTALEGESLRYWDRKVGLGEEPFPAADAYFRQLSSPEARPQEGDSRCELDEPSEGSSTRIQLGSTSGITELLGQLTTHPASQCHEAGLDRAIRLAKTCLATEAVAGAHHVIVSFPLTRLFLLLVRRLGPDRCRALGERVLESRENQLGLEHPLTEHSRVNLGAAHILRGNAEEATALLCDPGLDARSDPGTIYWSARLLHLQGDAMGEAAAWARYLEAGAPMLGRRIEARRRLSELEGS